MVDSTPLRRCSKCGASFPSTSEFFRKNGAKLRTECKSCSRAFGKEYRERCADEIHASQVAWREKNPEYFKVYRQNHRAQRNAYNILWRRRNRTRYLASRRTHRAEQCEYFRLLDAEWRSRNRPKLRIKYSKRRAMKRTLPNTLTPQQWQAALEYWNNRCAICGRLASSHYAIAVDHWIPLTKGGGTTANNALPLCDALKNGVDGCNESKGNRDPQQWLIDRLGTDKSEIKLVEIQRYFQWVEERSNNSTDLGQLAK